MAAHLLGYRLGIDAIGAQQPRTTGVQGEGEQQVIGAGIVRAEAFGTVNGEINNVFQATTQGRAGLCQVCFQQGDVQAIFEQHTGADTAALEAHHQEQMSQANPLVS